MLVHVRSIAVCALLLIENKPLLSCYFISPLLVCKVHGIKIKLLIEREGHEHQEQWH